MKKSLDNVNNILNQVKQDESQNISKINGFKEDGIIFSKAQEPNIQTDKSFLISKRDQEAVEVFKKIIKETKTNISIDEKEALFKLPINVADMKIKFFSEKTTDIIISNIFDDAIYISGNPLIEGEDNEAKKTMKDDLANLSFSQISEKYPYIKVFSPISFKNEVMPLEEDKLLNFYYTSSAKFLNIPSNIKQLKDYSNFMLSSELDINLEDIARI
jgi:hypothetical protein